MIPWAFASAVALAALVSAPPAAFPQGVPNVEPANALSKTVGQDLPSIRQGVPDVGPANALLDAAVQNADARPPAEFAGQALATTQFTAAQNADAQPLAAAVSTDMVGSLMAEALRFEADGAHDVAIAVLEEALDIVRPTHGLYSLEQAPLLQRLIVNEEARGNAQRAWNLEQELLDLARRHPGDIRTVAVYREIAARRADILARYVGGDFPEQIILGCYYSPRWGRVRRGGNNCRSGSRGVVVSALLGESRRYYDAAIQVIVNQGVEYADELREIDLALARTSFRYAHFLSSYGVGRRSLLRLAALDRMTAEPLLTRTESLTHLIDWDLLFVDGATRKSRAERTDAVVQRYERTHERLRSEGAPQAVIDTLFAPAIPVVLPSFLPNPLQTAESPGASPRHIDVSFVVTRFGHGERIEILDTTTGATQSEREALVELIEDSKFRPRATNGRFVDTAPIVVRYHLNR